MTAENTTLNGGARVTGDLFVPGTPTIRLNGSPAYGGTQDGAGSATPASHTITLNGGAALRHVVRRTDALALPVVAAPSQPAGTRSVSLNKSGQSPGDFATLKHLTLNSNVGPVTVPPGTYGNFTANSGSGFVLGTAGATAPAVYNFQNLTLNSNSTFAVAGPVVVTVDGGFSTNTTMGAPDHPEWLKLRIAGGGLSLASNRTVYAHLEAPDGTLTLNGNSTLDGAVAVDRLIVNGNAVLRLGVAATPNQPPVVSLTAPANGSTFTAPAGFTLTAVATDSDGSVAKVEFYQGAMKLGEDMTSPYAFSVNGLTVGSYSYTARVIDNLGAATSSAAINVTVAAPANQPPTVALTAPTAGASYVAPAAFTLAATAADADGTVAKVEFYEGTTKLGEDATSPYSLAVSGLAAGSYSYTVRAFDNLGAFASSAAVNLMVTPANQPPTVALSSPVDGAGYTAPTLIHLEAIASDSDGTVAKVEFFQGETRLGEATTAPYVYDWTVTASGSYALTARAVDNSGATAVSAVRTVAVSAGLPFVADFEQAEGYTLGLLAGQGGWLAPGITVVTEADKSHGLQSVLVPGVQPAATVKHTFPAIVAEPVVFVDYFALPVAGADTATGSRFETDATRFALVQLNDEGVFQVFNGDGTGSGTWESTPARLPVAADGLALNWARLTVRADYVAKKWDLYVGGTMMAADVGFTDNSLTAFSAFTLFGHSNVASGMDDFLAGFDNPLFADADRDGMDDAWETAHGLNPAANDRAADPDADGLSNIKEYQLGTDPNNADTDGDGIADEAERTLGTNPKNADTDGDGLPDGWEKAHGLDPLSATDASLDSDGDGLTNNQEFAAGSDPADYYNGQAPIVTIVSGNDQNAVAGEFNAQPMVVSVTNAAGTDLLINAPVIFSVQSGGGLLATANSEDPVLSATITLHTDASGLAQAYYQQPGTANTHSQISVSASSGQTQFATDSTAATDPGDLDQNGMADVWELQYFGYTGVGANDDPDGDGRSNVQEFSAGSDPTDYYNGVLPQVTSLVAADGTLGVGGTLRVLVTDHEGRPLANAPVTFHAVAGGHHLSASPGERPSASVSVLTGSTGIAQAYVRQPRSYSGY